MMKPHHTQRIVLILTTLLLASALLYAVIQLFRNNIQLFLTPTELQEALLRNPERTYRLGGQVLEGSLSYPKGQIQFILTDGLNQTTVRTSALLPDLFREGQGIVTLGHWDGEHFQAHNVLAKHDENYTPYPPGGPRAG